MQDPEETETRYHTVIFVATDDNGDGYIHHVTGDITAGMTYQSKRGKQPGIFTNILPKRVPWIGANVQISCWNRPCMHVYAAATCTEAIQSSDHALWKNQARRILLCSWRTPPGVFQVHRVDRDAGDPRIVSSRCFRTQCFYGLSHKATSTWTQFCTLRSKWAVQPWTYRWIHLCRKIWRPF